MNNSRSLYWIGYVCHVKVRNIICRITRCTHHHIAIMEEISEEPRCRSIHFLDEINGCLRHFSIEKFDLIVGYNSTIRDNE